MTEINLPTYKLRNDWKTVFDSSTFRDAHFFGYYDRNPLDLRGNYLLTHKVKFDGRNIKEEDICEIGYFDIKAKSYFKVDYTNSWNWQQGSNLQWVGQKHEFAYNKFSKGEFITVFNNINQDPTHTIDYPIYIIDPTGKFGLSIDYKKLYWCRPGYNYQSCADPKSNYFYNKEDSIRLINLENGLSEKIIYLTELMSIDSCPSMYECYNWLEHMSFSPCGKMFAFFHRWNSNKHGIQTRLYVYCLKTKKLTSFPDSRFISHFNWKTSSEITVWIGQANKKSKFISYLINSSVYKKFRPTLRFLTSRISNEKKAEILRNDQYITFNLELNTSKTIDRNVVPNNGHPSWDTHRNKMVTDTYEDNNNIRRLYLYEEESNTAELIGEFYSQYNNCYWRCDLHPRFSTDFEKIVIDSAHGPLRQILIISRL